MQPKNIRKYQKPNLLKTTIRIVLVLVLLGGSTAFLCWIYNYSNWFPIRNFNVITQSGSLQHVTAEEINTLLTPYRSGFNFLSINLNGVKEKFEQKSWIDKVEVGRSWPDTIKIVISERQPLAKWKTHDKTKKSYLVDNKGNLFEADIAEADIKNSLVWFEGSINTEKIIFDLYYQIYPMLKKYNINVEKLEYTTRSTWILHIDDGIKIYLGRENVVSKLSQLLVVWNKLLESDDRPIQEIHMEYSNGFSVKY
ncbi:MAG: FtsQ-type POTRA domain-containing protein [Neisseriaceae bacterium]|nr:MAG: FtsQ-type POTRA domain-containing protein [Neisseriaceae bacterium]